MSGLECLFCACVCSVSALQLFVLTFEVAVVFLWMNLSEHGSRREVCQGRTDTMGPRGRLFRAAACHTRPKAQLTPLRET